MKLSVIVVAALSVAGCATESTTTAAETPYCAQEARTGTNLPKTVCRTAQTKEQERQAADDFRESIIRTPTTIGR